MAFSDNNWHEWICHTNFSFLLGASHPKELVSRAVKLNYSSLGICDYDGVYGIARAYRALKDLKEDNGQIKLKLRYGAEIHFEKDHDLPIYFQNTLILYAQTHRGYFNLCKLLTHSHRDGKEYANIPLDFLFASQVDDIIAIQPMRGLIRGKKGENLEFLANHFGRLKDHFSERLYFAISRHLNRVEDKWITPTLKLAKYLKSPIIPAQDVFFATRQNKDLSDLLHAIRHNKTLDEVSDQLFINSRRCPQPFSSLRKIYADIPGIETALKTSEKLAET
ncbi:PHP domain-containing protein, partial [bacterium]|nr:PHP domain-containing protein [bacterium]